MVLLFPKWIFLLEVFVVFFKQICCLFFADFLKRNFAGQASYKLRPFFFHVEIMDFFDNWGVSSHVASQAFCGGVLGIFLLKLWLHISSGRNNSIEHRTSFPQCRIFPQTYICSTVYLQLRWLTVICMWVLLVSLFF